MEETEIKQVIVLRKDLNMRKGKMIVQGAHASLDAVLGLATVMNDQLVLITDARIALWMKRGFAKICVWVNSEHELLAIFEKAEAAGLPTSLVQDAGLTEFNGVATYTAVAVGPENSKKIDEITGALPLL